MPLGDSNGAEYCVRAEEAVDEDIGMGGREGSDVVAEGEEERGAQDEEKTLTG